MPFSPVKLVFLLGWVYLSLYLVQRVEDSPLVPSQYRSILHVVTLFVGPLVFLGAGVDRRQEFDRARHARELLRRHHSAGQDAVKNILARARERPNPSPRLRLFDSLGTELSEIYGHGEQGVRETGMSST